MERNDTPTIAVFEGPAEARAAVGLLLSRGVDKDEVLAIAAENHERLAELVETEDGSDDRTVEPVVVGGSVGALVGAGGAAAGLIAAGASLTPLGPIIGGAAAMAVTGGLVSAMAKRGTSADEVDYYDQALREGQVLVVVEPSEKKGAPDRATLESALREAGGRVSRADVS